MGRLLAENERKNLVHPKAPNQTPEVPVHDLNQNENQEVDNAVMKDGADENDPLHQGILKYDALITQKSFRHKFSVMN